MLEIYDITCQCPSCKIQYIPDLLLDNPKDFLPRYKRWKNDKVTIQTAFPSATATEREQLQTGICSDECWDEFLNVAEKGRE